MFLLLEWITQQMHNIYDKAKVEYCKILYVWLYVWYFSACFPH